MMATNRTHSGGLLRPFIFLLVSLTIYYYANLPGDGSSNIVSSKDSTLRTSNLANDAFLTASPTAIISKRRPVAALEPAEMGMDELEGLMVNPCHCPKETENSKVNFCYANNVDNQVCFVVVVIEVATSLATLEQCR